MAAINQPHEVANLALGLVGHRQFIDSLNESTTEAQVAKLYWAQVRNRLLADYRWRFATKRQVLALTTSEREGWGYCYAAPADMLVPHAIQPATRNPSLDESIPFAWELNDSDDGMLVLTDQEEAVLIYTREVTTVALYPPHFVDALAAALAVRFAGALPVKPQLMPALEQQAQRALLTAAAIDANSAKRDPAPDSEFITTR